LAAAVFTLASGLGHTQETDDLESLKPQQYSVEVSGRVATRGVGLDAGNGDADVSVDQVKRGEVSERLLFTYDTYYKPENRTGGPYEITMILGPDYSEIEGVDKSDVIISLHFSEDIEPGTYEVTEGFIDVGPNSAPVSVMVAAASADRKQRFMFSWKVEGIMELETINRQEATGRFEFSAYGMNRKGQITDETISAKGAFRSVPYTPEESLPEDLR
jgi:hypothetical protein